MPKSRTKRAPKKGRANKKARRVGDRDAVADAGGFAWNFKRVLDRVGIKPCAARTRTGQWRALFIEALSATANVTVACQFAGVDRVTAYEHRKRDEVFAGKWDGALNVAVDLMEAEMQRRAFAGVERPVFQGKELVGTITEYSDTLAIFLAKAHRPEKFRERISVKDETPRQPIDPASRAAEVARFLGEVQQAPDPAGSGAGGAAGQTGG